MIKKEKKNDRSNESQLMVYLLIILVLKVNATRIRVKNSQEFGFADRKAIRKCCIAKGKDLRFAFRDAFHVKMANNSRGLIGLSRFIDRLSD